MVRFGKDWEVGGVGGTGCILLNSTQCVGVIHEHTQPTRTHRQIDTHTQRYTHTDKQTDRHA